MLAQVIRDLKDLPSAKGDLLEIRLDDLKEFQNIQTPLILTYKNLPVAYIDGPVGNLQSYHNYHETPADLERILKELKQKEAKLYKIATFANSSLDTLRILQLQKKEGGSLVAIAMGELGKPSRLLGPIFGAPLGYAALDTSSISAPGQFTLDEMDSYSVDPSTQIFALIGDPITQSISHLTHNAYFKKRNINAIYVKFKVAKGELAPFLEISQEIGFKGLSVTTPHKEAILSHLDEIDPLALEIGAVNTVVFKEGKRIGYNTDILAIDVIKKHLPLANTTVQIYGAGGAARALIYGCRREGAKVFITNRTKERAQELARIFGCQEGVAEAELAINCTTIDFPSSSPYAMDINFKPHSLFLKGKHPIFGHEMFSVQALGQFKLWDLLLQECPKVP